MQMSKMSTYLNVWTVLALIVLQISTFRRVHSCMAYIFTLLQLHPATAKSSKSPPHTNHDMRTHLTYGIATCIVFVHVSRSVQ